MRHWWGLCLAVLLAVAVLLALSYFDSRCAAFGYTSALYTTDSIYCLKMHETEDYRIYQLHRLAEMEGEPEPLPTPTAKPTYGTLDG